MENTKAMFVFHCWVWYQQLWGAQQVQSEGLNPGVMDPQIPVNARTFDTRQNAKVGGQPGGFWKHKKHKTKWKNIHSCCLFQEVLDGLNVYFLQESTSKLI